MRTKVFLIFVFLLTALNAQTTYYVSSSQGNDANNGTTSGTPWKTIAKVNSITLQPGDIVKFKKGEKFYDSDLIITNSEDGTSTKRIIITSYGSGNQPQIGDSIASANEYTSIIYGDYITLQDLHIIGGNPSSSNARGIVVFGDNVTINSCKISGGNKSRASYSCIGISISSNSRNTRIYNNIVYGYSYGIQQGGNGIETIWANGDSLIIDGNEVFDCWRTGTVEQTDCIRIIEGNYNYQAVVKNNNVYWFGEQGMDFNNGTGIIVEYNEVHHPKEEIERSSIGTSAFKMGGKSKNIFRFNIIHDIWTLQLPNGDFNSGAFTAGTMYGGLIAYNLVYNVYGAGVVVSGASYTAGFTDTLKIYNNTFITGSSAIQIWGSTNFKVDIKNNIIKSGIKVSGKIYSYVYPRNETEQQQIWHGTDSYAYPTTYDIRYQPTSSIAKCYVDANVFIKDASPYNCKNSQYLYIGQTKNNLGSTNPLFNNEANNDYTLKANSPAKGLGIYIGILNDLFDGNVNNPPDAGAIAFGSSTNASGFNINTRIFLEGPFNNGSMLSALYEEGHIPLEQPFNSEPWNYNGNESVTSTPQGVIDWVLIEIRSGISASTIIGHKAALLTNDGSIVGLDGISKPSFEDLSAGDYYLVIRHRNHLDIMSTQPLSLSSNSSLYDFTTGPDKAYGTDPMNDLGNGRWGMYAGDGDTNGIVNVVDYGSVGNFLLQIGYKIGDLDLNGVINILDYSKTNSNLFKSSQVPN